jgi:DNA-binding XRE family transcriptional regulator
LTSAASTPLLEGARELCAAHGVELLDLLEELGQRLEEIAPAGCRVSECGSCGRRSAVPSGATLREHREAHHFTQGDVAREAKCVKQHISHVEMDKRDPSPAVVRAYEALAARAREAAEAQ